MATAVQIESFVRIRSRIGNETQKRETEREREEEEKLKVSSKGNDRRSRNNFPPQLFISIFTRVARSFIFSRLLYFRLRARPHPPLARPGCTPSPHPDAREQQRSNERPRAPRTLQLALPNHFRARPKFRWNTNLRSSFPASPLVREDRLYEDVE